MKKIVLSLVGLLMMSQMFFVSCTSMQTAGVGKPSALGTVQNVLNSGLLEAFGIMGDKNKFLSNALIEAAMPKDLKKLNGKLEDLGLSSIVNKEKDYIARIAGKTVTKAKPILEKAVNNMTPADAVAILAGKKDAGTNYLRNVAGGALTTALKPTVDSQLKSLGVTSMIDKALGGKNSSLGALAGLVLGTGSSSTSVSGQMSDWVTMQLVDGVFNVVANKEKQARGNVLQGLQGILGGGQ